MTTAAVLSLPQGVIELVVTENMKIHSCSDHIFFQVIPFHKINQPKNPKRKLSFFPALVTFYNFYIPIGSAVFPFS